MQVFLSYAAEDRDIAEQIQLALTGAGNAVFFDRESLPRGGDYHARIRAAVNSSDVFVFLVSPDSVSPGSYGLTELKYARAKWPHPKGRVLAVIVRRAPWDAIPNYLKAVTVLEPEGNVAAEVSAAVSELKRGGTSQSDEVPVTKNLGPGIFGRVVAWFLGLSLSWRLVTIFGLAFGAIAVTLGQPLVAAATKGWAVTAHFWSHPDDAPALSPADRLALTAMRQRLNSYLQTEVLRLKDDPTWRPDPWNVAQIVVALDDSLPVPNETIVGYFKSSTAPDRGWPQPADDSVSHLGASGWITFALGTLGQPLERDQYEFFLTSQSSEGWWPQFAQGKTARENASTYATVWQLIGLHEHLRQSLVDDDIQARVGAAIDRGYAWLEYQEGPTAEERWTDYPFASGEEFLSTSERTKIRESVTSLVLHCLHSVNPERASLNLKDFDSMWLTGVPSGLPFPMDSGRTDHWVQGDGFRRQDVIRHYRLPWTLLGMVDAYPNGSISEHVAVSESLSEFLGNGLKYIDGVKGYTWIGSELLYALNELQRRIDGAHH